MPSFKVKKVLMYAAVAFVVFYLFSQPAQAARAVNGALNGVLTGANQLAVFFTSLAT
jgi:hypothetical protein